MSLSGNTEKINELLSKINALPEAGGGAGELQFVTGTYTPTSGNLYNTPVSVTGIVFKPKYVAMFFDGSTTGGTGSRLLSIDSLGNACAIYDLNKLPTYLSGANSTSSTNKYAKNYLLSITNDGFTVTALESTAYIYTHPYAYVAIG